MNSEELSAFRQLHDSYAATVEAIGIACLSADRYEEATATLRRAEDVMWRGHREAKMNIGTRTKSELFFDYYKPDSRTVTAGQAEQALMLYEAVMSPRPEKR